MAEEYDGTIHKGQTADVLKKKHEKARRNEKEAKWPSYRNYFKARAILLEELSQPPEGRCECHAKGIHKGVRFTTDKEAKDNGNIQN